MWNYVPGGRSPEDPPVHDDELLDGFGLTNDDLVRDTRWSSPRFEMTVPEAPEPGILYVECVPKEGLPIVWGFVVLAVREADLFRLGEILRREGTLAREIGSRIVQNVSAAQIPGDDQAPRRGRPRPSSAAHRSATRHPFSPDIFPSESPGGADDRPKDRHPGRLPAEAGRSSPA